MLTTAIEYATEKHGDQKRKFSGHLFIVHPLRVMAHVMLDRYYKNDLFAPIVAVLHDVEEDCTGDSDEERLVLSDEIACIFGEAVRISVDELTNEYTHERHPSMNRELRKSLEFARLTEVSDRSKTIKLYDRIANLTDMVECFGDARKFAHMYAKESWQLATCIGTIENEYLVSEVLRLSAKLYQETR